MTGPLGRGKVRRSRSRRAIAGLLVLLGAVGCGGETGSADPTEGVPSGHASAAPTVADALTRCGTPELESASAVRFPASEGGELYGIEAGSGTRGVLLVHGSGQSGVCVWTQEIPALAAEGFSVLGIDHACVGESSCPDDGSDLVEDIAAGVQRLRERGATAVVVVGASAGTAEVIVAAATPTVELAAAVALSPGRLDAEVTSSGDGPRTAREAGQDIGAPMLYVVAADDRLSSVADTRALHDATPQQYRNLIDVPVGGHAQELLYAGGVRIGAAPGGPVYADVLAFLRQHTES